MTRYVTQAGLNGSVTFLHIEEREGGVTEFLINSDSW